MEGKKSCDVPIVKQGSSTSSYDDMVREIYLLPAVEFYKHRLPDLALLKTILEDLRATRRSHLALDFTRYGPIKSKRRICLSHEEVGSIFGTVLRSGCEVAHIYVNETGFLGAALSKGNCSYEQLFEFSGRLQSVNITDLVSHDAPDWGLVSMASAATGLGGFSIRELGWCACPEIPATGGCQQALTITNPLLLSQANHALRWVSLSGVALHPSIFIAVLRSWMPTLTELSLCCVYIQARGNEWLEIFRCLHSSQILESFQTVGLVDDNRNSRLQDGTLAQGYVLLHESDGRNGDKLVLNGRQDVQEGLLLNIERGMHETFFYDDE
ncbi:hypothetical protein PRZ48_007599 [Zasmidium cellare]|uniref:Uncharacterized protein n=1 Tax=Zasmidium cellare TaxID=395010 RepID=A0ABR0EKK5_ZASCE|nr:hypothetical protein PRZ48_007599 [Zasmidium cellare]